MKIHIMGASCAGSTTLGQALADKLHIPYFDTDDHFWVKTGIPYTVKREPTLRIQALKDDMAKQESCIVGGSLVSWGEEWKAMFDLVVFLYLPAEIRLNRLKAREVERYGDTIYTDPVRNQLYKDFIAWAAKYDDRNFTGRNIGIHEDWFGSVTCPVLQIRGDKTVDERVEMVLAAVDSLK
ncbi:shikimate kinase [Mucilaginibacter glaciei]|uniref:Adenylate kinase n=1 Tax=Mucilaginibacter glaciei TaxID=2772109 RepID=A0A926NGN5_9SPHI|nr:shikimate kinase [Mucilaginibacter glaciei]MBD1391739.1 adenylate kinase [Mucilaginibacter glaciei]